MAEPWLKYQTTDGPWTKYAKAAGTAAQAVGETAAVMATDIPATAVAGLTGIATGGDIGAMEAVKESLSYEPSEVGQQSLQRIGESIQEVTKYLPLEEIATTWTDSIVPAMQEKFGTKKGAALAASMLGLVNAAAEFNPATKTVKKVGGTSTINSPKLDPFTDQTTVQWYDRAIKNPEYFKREKKIDAKMVNMTPDEYLAGAQEGFEKLGYKSSPEIMRSQRREEVIQQYADDMRKGDKFPALALDFSMGQFDQEGIHRAFAAKELGLESVPVVVLRDIEK